MTLPDSPPPGPPRDLTHLYSTGITVGGFPVLLDMGMRHGIPGNHAVSAAAEAAQALNIVVDQERATIAEVVLGRGMAIRDLPQSSTPRALLGQQLANILNNLRAAEDQVDTQASGRCTVALSSRMGAALIRVAIALNECHYNGEPFSDNMEPLADALKELEALGKVIGGHGSVAPFKWSVS